MFEDIDPPTLVQNVGFVRLGPDHVSKQQTIGLTCEELIPIKTDTLYLLVLERELCLPPEMTGYLDTVHPTSSRSSGLVFR